MKQKGFTLIELLAVIVILAVIALIATPMVLDTINKSKKGAGSVTEPTAPAGPTYYYAFGTPTTSNTTNYTEVGKSVFARLGSDGSHGICINDGGLFCINTNDLENSKTALKAHFGESSCADRSSVSCTSSAFYCSADSNGDVHCNDNSAYELCYALADGTFYCN